MFYPSLDGEQCRGHAESSRAQSVVSWGLIVWVLLCYIPQWARIVSRRSAEGISALYILLGSLSGVCAVGNILMLPSSVVEIGCCRSRALFSCINNLLGMFQVTLGIACFWIILFMFYYYSEEESHVALGTETGRNNRRRCRHAHRVLLVSNGFALLVLLISAIILHSFSWASAAWADILGVSLAVGACLQWLPQIVTTWRLGHLGSLSPASLCFLAPYTWITGINMMIRVGLKGWSAWIVYVLVGSMQLVLLGFAVVFSLRDPDEPIECDSLEFDKALLEPQTHTTISQSKPMSQISENSPLLGSGR